MAEKEKCFCHLNGYKVKDADARSEIADAKKDINTLFNNVNNLSTVANANAIRLNTHDEKIAALENGAGGGSGGPKYVMLTEKHATNGYKVPDNIRYVLLKKIDTSNFSYHLSNKEAIIGTSYNTILYRGTSQTPTPLKLEFSEDGYLYLTSTGPSTYLAMVELVESIEGLDSDIDNL